MKPTTLALALSSVTVLGCAALPTPLPPGSDPANPRAPEAPAVALSPVLRSDPPPAMALQPPAAGAGMQMGGESIQHGGHGGMQQQEQDAGMQHETDAGMQHDHMHHGASGPGDAGSTMPEPHHDHHGAQPAKPAEARDGGSP
jgi:hypothetical protein